MPNVTPQALPPYITEDAIAVAEALVQAYTGGTGSIQLQPIAVPFLGKTATFTPGPIAVTMA